MKRRIFQAVFTFLLLSTVVACIEGRKRPARLTPCPNGQDAEGNCVTPSPVVQRVKCLAGYKLKQLLNGTCVFYTSSQQACEVPGLIPVAKHQAPGCLVKNHKNDICELAGINHISKECVTPIPPQADAGVSVYLEVKDGLGLVPRIRFSPGVKANAGAELTFKSHAYELQEGIEVKKEDDTPTSITLPLNIPWQLIYTTVDGREVCATGILNGSHTSATNPSPGTQCIATP